MTLVPTPFSELISSRLLPLGAMTLSRVLAILRPRLIPLEFSVVAELYVLTNISFMMVSWVSSIPTPVSSITSF